MLRSKPPSVAASSNSKARYLRQINRYPATATVTRQRAATPPKAVRSRPTSASHGGPNGSSRFSGFRRAKRSCSSRCCVLPAPTPYAKAMNSQTPARIAASESSTTRSRLRSHGRILPMEPSESEREKGNQSASCAFNNQFPYCHALLGGFPRITGLRLWVLRSA